MLKRLIEMLRRRKELRALLRKEGASVVIADLQLTASHRELLPVEHRMLQRLYAQRARFTRLRLLRMNELSNKQMSVGLTPTEADELVGLLKAQRNG